MAQNTGLLRDQGMFIMRAAAAAACAGGPLGLRPQLLSDVSAGLLVTDYSPLRLGRQWRQQVGRSR